MLSLVTGANGFFGRALVRELRAKSRGEFLAVNAGDMRAPLATCRASGAERRRFVPGFSAWTPLAASIEGSGSYYRQSGWL